MKSAKGNTENVQQKRTPRLETNCTKYESNSKGEGLG